jgi:hypothetical protein
MHTASKISLGNKNNVRSNTMIWLFKNTIATLGLTVSGTKLSMNLSNRETGGTVEINNIPINSNQFRLTNNTLTKLNAPDGTYDISQSDAFGNISNKVSFKIIKGFFYLS